MPRTLLRYLRLGPLTDSVSLSHVRNLRSVATSVRRAGCKCRSVSVNTSVYYKASYQVITARR
jgi:hypothetical protein